MIAKIDDLHDDASGEPRVTVFRERVLPGSETFIRNQLDSMRRWRPTLIGLERIESPLSRPTDQFVFPKMAGIRRRLAKVTGRSAALEAKLSETRPKVVHAHFGSDASMIVHAVQRLRAPLVVTFHGLDVTVLPNRNDFMARRYQARLPTLLEQADRLLAVSDFIASRLVRLGAPESKIRVLPIGIPLHAERHVAPSDRRGVLFVGRLVPVKGLEDGLRAFAALPAGVRRTHPLTLIGEGEEYFRLRALAAELGIRVEFKGALPPPEVAQHMSQAAVLIGPSKTAGDGAQEALGMVFLEAAAESLPVVAYGSGGIAEAVVDGRTGLLAPEGNVRGLTYCLQTLLSDERMRIAFGADARKRVTSKFDIRTQTAILEGEYDRIAWR